MSKKPKRLFRNRPALPPMPPIPPEAEKLRHARDVIDPDRIYEMEMPDGKIMRTSGRELLATSDNMLALVDAQKAGDEEAIRKAVKKIMEE